MNSWGAQMSNRNKMAAYYRLRAKQLREIALAMAKDDCRETLILCAADYDYLAKRNSGNAGPARIHQ